MLLVSFVVLRVFARLSFLLLVGATSAGGDWSWNYKISVFFVNQLASKLFVAEAVKQGCIGDTYLV